MVMAHNYVLVGDHEAAITMIERLLSMPSRVSIGWLRIDPFWDPVRDHPRFQELLAREDIIF